MNSVVCHFNVSLTLEVGSECQSGVSVKHIFREKREEEEEGGRERVLLLIVVIVKWLFV